jgi:hypothetical protein
MAREQAREFYFNKMKWKLARRRLEMTVGRKEFRSCVIIAPTRSTCVNIHMVLTNGKIPPTLLMQEKGEMIFESVDKLGDKGFGIVAGTGTGKTVAIRDIARRVLGEDLRVDIVTREHEATEHTWACNTLVITPGIALNWLKDGIITGDDLIIVDEIHQTSEHLELALALAKRVGCTFLWMSATIDSTVYARYLNASHVIRSNAFDPQKKSMAEVQNGNIEQFLDQNIGRFIDQKRAVAVFVPTRALAENLAKKYEREDLYTDFYHGGENAEKLRQFLQGQVPKPFMIFMTIAGSSSLNILGLDTVVIVDEIYKEVIHASVKVMEKVKLGNNELLQMGGRVNGRMEKSEIWILSKRPYLDFHALKPVAPDFVLGGDLERVALTCAKLGVNVSGLDLIASLDGDKYEEVLKNFRRRGIIEKEIMALTEYGEKIERLPVDRAWAEMIIHAQRGENPDLLMIVMAVASIESLYSLIRRGPDEINYGDLAVSGSDHLTSYNIFALAMQYFGYVKPSRDDAGLEYAFEGNFISKKVVNGQPEKEIGEFIAWCDENRFNAKAIKEVAIALKSVYRQIRAPLPEPQDFLLVDKGTDIHDMFVDLLARVQSLDFVSRGSNHKTYLRIWQALHSVAESEYSHVLGKIRFWKDKNKLDRASVEGTEIPEDLMEALCERQITGVDWMTDAGVHLSFKRAFAGKDLGEFSDVVKDEEIPENFIPAAESAFLDWFMHHCGMIREHNRKMMLASHNPAMRRHAAACLAEGDERELYRRIFAGKRIMSPQSLLVAIKKGEVNPADLLFPSLDPKVAMMPIITLELAGEKIQFSPKEASAQSSEKVLRHLALAKQRKVYKDSLALGEDLFRRRRALKLTFQKLKNDSTGGSEWVSGSNKAGVKYVLDVLFSGEVREGVQYYCRIGGTIAKTSNFSIIAVTPIVQIGRDFDAEIVAIEKGDDGITAAPLIKAAPAPEAKAMIPAAAVAGGKISFTELKERFAR